MEKAEATTTDYIHNKENLYDLVSQLKTLDNKENIYDLVTQLETHPSRVSRGKRLEWRKKTLYLRSGREQRQVRPRK